LLPPKAKNPPKIHQKGNQDNSNNLSNNQNSPRSKCQINNNPASNQGHHRQCRGQYREHP